MDKDFEEFVITRCRKALEENEDYMKAEQSGENQNKLQAMAEIICYKKAVADLLTIKNIATKYSH